MKAFASPLPELKPETERLLWTAAIVLAASIPHWLALAPWIPVLLGGAIVWRIAVAQLNRRLPLRWLRLALAFVAFFGVLAQYRTINGVDAGSALLVVMIALKFLESHNQRDQLVLIMISYFLLFASLLTARSPLAVAYALVMVWLTTVALLQLGRRNALLPSRATATLAGKLLVQSLPIMVVLFLLFPRLPGPLWAIPGSTSSGASGLSDTMSPGDITNLGLSDEIAFRVQFPSGVPRASELYWRGPTMTTFDGTTWSMQLGMRRGQRIVQTVDPVGEPVDYRVMLEPTGHNWAFALDMPVLWSSDANLRMADDYQLRTFASRSSQVDYNVTSYLSYRAREPLSLREQATFRALPPDSSPRTRALVATWLEDDPAPQQIIDRAMAWLRSQPFFYTLTPPPLGRQPVDEFLFETREGFCEHYASAFAVMMRAAGLPARVVTGYQGGELNSLGHYYIIRQSDAHAWTEVWLQDRGWVRVDPIVAVAPERVALGSGHGSLSTRATGAASFRRLPWIRNILLAWDAANIYWDEWVIGYGPQMQQALLDLLGFDGMRRTKRWTALLLAVVATLIASSVVLSLALRRRNRRPFDPAARCFAEFGRRLARCEVAPRAPGEAPAAYGARAARRVPAAAADIDAIVTAYLRARYEPDAEGGSLEELRTRLAAFRPAG